MIAQLKGTGLVQRWKQRLTSDDDAWKRSQSPFVSVRSSLQAKGNFKLLFSTTTVTIRYPVSHLLVKNTETDESSHENIKSEDEMSPNDKACQTDLSGEDFDELIATKNKLNEELKNENKFKRNDTSVNFYTGIPSVACFCSHGLAR